MPGASSKPPPACRGTGAAALLHTKFSRAESFLRLYQLCMHVRSIMRRTSFKARIRSGLRAGRGGTHAGAVSGSLEESRPRKPPGRFPCRCNSS